MSYLSKGNGFDDVSAICPYDDPCCMKVTRGKVSKCFALSETKFKDGQCHFRKVDPYGPNMYDEARGRNDGRVW